MTPKSLKGTSDDVGRSSDVLHLQGWCRMIAMAKEGPLYAIVTNDAFSFKRALGEEFLEEFSAEAKDKHSFLCSVAPTSE